MLHFCWDHVPSEVSFTVDVEGKASTRAISDVTKADQLMWAIFDEQGHSGSNDMRDAFAGNITGAVYEQSLEATVPMSRPMAKFNFITTDLADFLAGNVALEGCKIVFKYNGFMPCAYNMHTSKPTDSRTGTSRLSWDLIMCL